jgi:hypothetical protein
MSLNTTPATWVAGTTVSAAQMNTEIRDAVTGIQAAWTAYTPTWAGSTTNPVLGNGTIAGRYMRVGKTFDVNIQLTMGSTTTFGTGVWSFSLPFTLLSGRAMYGNCDMVDTSASSGFFGNVVPFSTSSLSIRAVGAGAAANVTNLVPFTWATTDTLTILARGELA